MFKADIKIGYTCNNLCQFCVQARNRERGFKPRGEIEKSLLDARKKKCEQVVFTGGEPTLHPDFLYFIFWARKLGFTEIQIQTNGRLFAYLDFCRQVVQAGATEFSPALHGPDAKTHDSLTQAVGSFEQTVAGIKNLKYLKQRVIVNCVVTEKNYRLLPKIAQFLVNLDVDQFQFAFVHILGRAAENKNWLIPRKLKVAPYIKEGLRISKKAGILAMTEAIPLCFLDGFEDCVAEQYIPNSRVYDAGYIVEDFAKYRRVEGKAKGPECKKCKYYKVCEGPWKEYPEIFGWEEFKPVKK